ncbi:pyridoxine 5'-phosphate synthase [Hydrogenimonas urashimensis]|uniref:pyridoxine 5'-phosphate synthase n=1 Tax=Hydrogenimonas urashimensis TaxID=2740515 RepID=UPI001914DFCB|nr:pyridoxine 5'-phosphate synthase [Hydrogenimonas urashimensis]
MKLGVNIDHIAVLREARKINDPSPIDALGIVARAGADQITIHLREDRRHIHDEDAEQIVRLSPLPVNLECSIDEEIIEIVCRLRPHRATLVPERREEVTTEGGLDIFKYEDRTIAAIEKLHANEIEVSLFIDPDLETITRADALGAEWIELHTGSYANIHAMLHSNLPRTHHSVKALELPRHTLKTKLEESLETIRSAADHAATLGLRVAAGHGLNYRNVAEIVKIDAIEELNIGQSIIARSVFTGLKEAVEEMVNLLKR